MIDKNGTIISSSWLFCVLSGLAIIVVGCATMSQPKQVSIELRSSDGRVTKIPLEGPKSNPEVTKVAKRVKEIDSRLRSWEKSLRKIHPKTARDLRNLLLEKRDAAINDLDLAYQIANRTSGPLDEQVLASAKQNIEVAWEIIQRDPRDYEAKQKAAPPAPAPPPPAPAPVPSPAPPLQKPGILWNLWTEESPAPTPTPTFKPVAYLNQDKYYLLILDLSAISYGKNEQGVYTQTAGTSFQELVKKWLDSNIRKVSITTLLIVDPTHFETPEKTVGTLDVDLEKVRKLMNRGEIKIDGDPFEVMAKGEDPDFVFGRVPFRIKVKSGQPEGPASVSLSLWVNNRPVEEISVRLCISSDSSIPSKCQGVSRSQFGLRGVDSLRIASEEAPYPDAAIHFVELERENVYGVFRRNDSPSGEYVSWPLDMKPEDLRTMLTHWIDAFVATRDDESQLLMRAEGLYNILFPQSQVAARSAFEKFIEPYLDQDPAAASYKPASIFVRLIQQGPDRPLLIPLGLMAVSLDKKPAKFLGFYFRIETPLEMQSYQTSEVCLSRWVTVSPLPGVNDPALKQAVERLKNLVPIWREQALNPFEDMTKFGQWIKEKDTEKDGIALVILSHHTKDRISFESQKLVMSAELTRRFSKPSVVILDGCGTGSPGAVDFVRQFNRNGVDTVVATSTEVNPIMAGDFLDTLATVLDQNKDNEKFNISAAHFKTLQLMRNKVPPDGNNKYGPRVLEYTLIGNGNVRLCPPKK